MEFTAEDAKVLIRTGWACLSSPQAQRFYVLAIGSIVLVGCLIRAIRADRQATDKLGRTEAILDRKFKGPIPKLRSTFDRQQAIIRKRAERAERRAGHSLWQGFVSGAVVPTAMLGAVTFWYRWFDPQGAHLLDAEGHPLSHPTILQSVIFTADQTFRGGLLDFLEVFAIHFTPLVNNPANRFFSTGVFAHHLFVEAFLFTCILLYGRARWQIDRIRRRVLRKHRERYEDALKQVAKEKDAAVAAFSLTL